VTSWMPSRFARACDQPITKLSFVNSLVNHPCGSIESNYLLLGSLK
jgi:hypothetical protein